MEKDYIAIERYIKDLEIVHSEAHNVFLQLQSKYDKTTYRETTLLMLLARAIKFLKAYMILIKKGYGEPGMTILRSIFETNLWIRWCAKDEINAETYFTSGKAEAVKLTDVLLKGKYCDSEMEQRIEKERQNYTNEKNHFPSWKKMAIDTDMKEIYDFVYSILSSMSHGSLMSLGERLDDLLISTEPDSKNILPSIPLANNFSRDCYLVCAMWIYEKKIRPVPNLSDLLKVKSL